MTCSQKSSNKNNEDGIDNGHYPALIRENIYWYLDHPECRVPYATDFLLWRLLESERAPLAREMEGRRFTADLKDIDGRRRRQQFRHMIYSVTWLAAVAGSVHIIRQQAAISLSPARARLVVPVVALVRCAREAGPATDYSPARPNSRGNKTPHLRPGDDHRKTATAGDHPTRPQPIRRWFGSFTCCYDCRVSPVECASSNNGPRQIILPSRRRSFPRNKARSASGLRDDLI